MVEDHRDLAGLVDRVLVIEVETATGAVAMATGAVIEGAEIAENQIEVEMATVAAIGAAIVAVREDRAGRVDLVVVLAGRVDSAVIGGLAEAISAVAAVVAAAAAAHRREGAIRRRRKPAIA